MATFDQHLVDILDGFERPQQSNLAEKIEAALGLIVPSLKQHRPLLVCGNGGSAADALHSDRLIDVPSTSTPRVQEMHLVVYHYLCERVESALLGVVT